MTKRFGMLLSAASRGRKLMTSVLPFFRRRRRPPTEAQIAAAREALTRWRLAAEFTYEPPKFSHGLEVPRGLESAAVPASEGTRVDLATGAPEQRARRETLPRFGY